MTSASVSAATCAGMAAWCSAGALALSDAGAQAVRVGVLPSPWWLVASILAANALVWVTRLSPDRARPLFFSVILWVPWLPVGLPPAALVWTGPVALAVWVAIAAAIAATIAASGGPGGDTGARTPGALARWLSTPVPASGVAFVLALIVYLSAAGRIGWALPDGDEPHYLIIAQSLWRDHDLQIENNHARRDYVEYVSREIPPDFLRRGTDGEIYSIHMPGVPALIAPVLAAGGYRLVTMTLAAVSAAATAVAWRMAFALTASAAAAWFGWAAVALTVPFLLLSFTVYPDGPAAAVVLLAAAALVAQQTRPDRPARWWTAVGLLPALLPWFHTRFAVLAAMLGLVLALRALGSPRRWTALAAGFVLPLVSAAGWFSYFAIIYGTPNPSAPYGDYTQMSLGRLPVGLTGLLADQQFGLLAVAPVLAIGLAGFVPFWRRYRRLAVEWLLIIVPYLMVTSMYHMWWGGFSSPARFAGSTLLLLAVPAAMAFAAAREAATRTAQIALLALSVGMTLLLLWTDRGLFCFNTRDQVAPWLVWMGQVADLARGWPSLFRSTAGVAAAGGLTWAAALALAWAVTRAIGRHRHMGRGSTGLLLLGTGALAVMTALSVVWRIEGRTGLAATTGQLRALEAADAGRRMIGVRFDPPAITAPVFALERLRIGAERSPDAAESTWFWLSRLPAGRYRAWIEHGASDLPFEALVFTGRSDRWLARWTADRLTDGRTGFELEIPIEVESLRITGSATSRRPVRSIHLQRVESRPTLGGLAEDRAGSSGRYGDVLLFSVAGGSYFEPGGVWTNGTREAELVIAGAPGRVKAALWIGAGAVETTMAVSAGSYADRSTLQAGERRLIELPMRPGKPLILRIQAGAGFRPSQTDPGSADKRLLGVRIEPSGEPAR